MKIICLHKKNRLVRNLLLPLLFLTAFFRLHAQKKDFAVIPNAGVTLGLISSGAGLHAGVNTTYALTNRLSVEGQLSFSTMSGQAYGGRSYNENVASALLGLRLYFNAPTKNSRIFVNYMAGAMRYHTRYPGEPESRGVDGAGSLGLYFAVDNRIFFGGSIEGDGYLVVKAGVNLLRKKSSGKS